jgi:hypothetical protein
MRHSAFMGIMNSARPVALSCDHGYDISGFIKSGEFLNQPSEYLLL